MRRRLECLVVTNTGKIVVLFVLLPDVPKTWFHVVLENTIILPFIGDTR